MTGQQTRLRTVKGKARSRPAIQCLRCGDWLGANRDAHEKRCLARAVKAAAKEPVHFVKEPT